MAIKTSGNALSLSEIQTEFGGTNPISLSEYYAGGGLVFNGTKGFPTASGTLIPSSGGISVSNFYGANAIRFPPTIDVLVVGGGGGAGGGSHYTTSQGGGGAGGYVEHFGRSIQVGVSYTATVGIGGNSPVVDWESEGDSHGTNGGNSTFDTITAFGGGGGAGGGTQLGSGGTPYGYDGLNGGSGGGAGSYHEVVRNTGITGSGGASTQTSNGGGTGYGSAGDSNGNGGGAGGGSNGKVFILTGLTYAKGGVVSDGASGSPNTGNGGNGNTVVSGGNGGTGVVIIAYSDMYDKATSTTGTMTYNNNNGYHIYTCTSGTCTITWGVGFWF